MASKVNYSSCPWTREQIPRQDGRTTLITGANSGVGFETAKALAERGAAVILACRDPERADITASQIRASGTAAALTVVHLDLASLGSVRDAAQKVRATVDRLDLLICNAGVGWAPYARTEVRYPVSEAAASRPGARGPANEGEPS